MRIPYPVPWNCPCYIHGIGEETIVLDVWWIPRVQRAIIEKIPKVNLWLMHEPIIIVDLIVFHHGVSIFSVSASTERIRACVCRYI